MTVSLMHLGFAQTPTDVDLRYTVFFESMGESENVVSPGYIGTACGTRKIEGFTIKSKNIKLRYKASFKKTGETKWFNSEEFCGSRGKYGHLQAFWIELQGEDADKYDIFYRADLQGTGTTPWMKNGQKCGKDEENRVVWGFSIEIRTKEK